MEYEYRLRVEYEKFPSVVLLDELCCLSNSAIRKFSLDTCYRIDMIRQIILERTGDRSCSELRADHE